MIDARHYRVPLLCRSAVLLGVLAVVLSASAKAQGQSSSGEIIIPPPAKIPAEPGQPAHQPRQSAEEPWKAHDDVTGHDLQWDCEKGTWMDLDTRRPVGYDAYRDDAGNIIPPPPIIKDADGTSHQATQGTTFHDKAYDQKTKEHLNWDAEKKTWKDDNGKELGFQGGRTRVCPKVEYKMKVIYDPTGNGDWKFDAPYKMYVSPLLEHRIYNNWDDVSGDDPTVVSHDATSSSNGFGLWTGVQLPRLPIIATVGGYWASGLDADAILTNGHHVHSDVDDMGLGLGFRFMPTSTRVAPWAEFSLMWQRNKSKYTELNSFNNPFLSENRVHSSWTGEYGAGATYWVVPRIGIDLGISYQGQFKSMNADENIRLSSGLVLRLGER